MTPAERCSEKSAVRSCIRRVVGGNEVIHASEIIARTFVTAVEWLPSVDSTNSHVLTHLHRDTQHPLLVGTDRQTAGRGRGRNRWFGGDGSLAFSLLLNPEQFGISVDLRPLLSLATGLAIRHAVAVWGDSPSCQVKWPNDVYLTQRKVAGILIETSAIRPELIVIGIGVNLNNTLEDAPAEVRERAITLFEILGQQIAPTDFLITLLQSLEQEFHQLSSDRVGWLASFRQHCSLTGKFVTVAGEHTADTGTCLGIDDDGALQLQTSSGIQRFYAGTVHVHSDD